MMKLDCTGRVANVTGLLAALQPAAVVPALPWLASTAAPTRAIACAGAGSFEAAHITLTPGLHLAVAPDTADKLATAWAQVSAREGEQVLASGAAPGHNELGLALAARR